MIGRDVGSTSCRLPRPAPALPCLFVIRKFIDVHDMRTQRDHCSISILCFAMLAMPQSKKLWEIFVLSFFLFSFCLFVILLLGLVRSMCSNPRDPLRYVHQCALPFCDPLVSLSAGFCQRRPSRSSKVQLMLVFVLFMTYSWVLSMFRTPD